METFKITAALMLLGALTLGLAEDAIDTQIGEINAAPTQERVKLMNQFKEKLSTLSAEERAEAITKLQTRTQTQTREKFRVNQAEQMENMKRSEQMHQNQIMDQTVQQNLGGASQGGSNTPGMMHK
jgi:phosphoribosylanthranilate isomerase